MVLQCHNLQYLCMQWKHHKETLNWFLKSSIDCCTISGHLWAT